MDKPSQATFGGLLRWAWPWADGDRRPLGTVTVGAGLSLGLTVLFFGPTKILPMAVDLVVLAAVVTNWSPLVDR